MKFEKVELNCNKHLLYVYKFIYFDELIATITIAPKEDNENIIELIHDSPGKLSSTFVFNQLMHELKSKLIIGYGNCTRKYFKMEDLEKLIEIIENFDVDMGKFNPCAPSGTYYIKWNEDEAKCRLYGHTTEKISENHYAIVEKPSNRKVASIELTDKNILIIHDTTLRFGEPRPHAKYLNELVKLALTRVACKVKDIYLNKIDNSKIFVMNVFDPKRWDEVRYTIETFPDNDAILGFDYRS